MKFSPGVDAVPPLPQRGRQRRIPSSPRPPLSLLMVLVAALLGACGMIGGGADEELDTSTKPDKVEEMAAHVPVPAGGALPHWGYSGPEGPEYWGQLAADWATCGTGKQQSPIDVTGGKPFVAAPTTTVPEASTDTTAVTPTTAKRTKATTTTEASTPSTEAPWPGAPAEQEIDFRYHPSAYTVVDNGHTVQVNLDDAGAMVIDGVPFKLLQFHFHAPSEHTLAEAHYPMEYHLVHRNEAGELAVVGVLVQRGGANETLAPIFDSLPDASGPSEGVEPIDPAELLPGNRTMVRYNGSLTTPPCAEHVRWHLMLTPKQMSNLQIARFVARHPDSRRPTQPLEDREVVVEIDKETHVAGAAASGHGASEPTATTKAHDAPPAATDAHASTPPVATDAHASTPPADTHASTPAAGDHPVTTAAAHDDGH